MGRGIEIELIKGIHPGLILERELQKRSLPRGRFAISIGEYPQTLGAVIKGRRQMNANLSIKLERELGFEEGFFMVLQAYYDIKVALQRVSSSPNIEKFRHVLFWDTKIENIDWIGHKESVIRRVFERGNDVEKLEIKRFYGDAEVAKIMASPAANSYTIRNPLKTQK